MKNKLRNQLKNLQPYVAAVLLGVLTMFSFAPFGLFPLAVIAPAGLCAILYQATVRRSFWVGFYFGIGLFGSGVYWVFISISRYGDVPAIIALFITAALIALLALFPATACYTVNRYFKKESPLRLTCAFPAIWVLSEWVRSWLFTGFPWLLLGYSQTNSPLSGYAPLGSVYLVSLLLMVSSGLVVEGLIALRKRNYITSYLNLVVISLIWVIGGLLCLIPWTRPVNQPITVSLIQGNIPQSLKWDPDNVALSLNTYSELSEPLWGKSDIIIWPEVAVPLPLSDAQDYVKAMAEKAAKTNTLLIFGIPEAAKTVGNTTTYYNTLIATGKYNASYHKRLLVPFGEYVPFQAVFARAFDFMNVPMSNMVPGEPHQAPMVLGNIKIVPSICYEVAYPDFSRSVDPSISLLLTVTNDAWFGESTAQAQHLQMAIMRSIEMARPGIFVSNDGITAIINPKGLIEEVAPTHTVFVLTSKIQAYEGLTPWMRNGIDALLAVILVMLVAAKREHKSRKRKPALATASKTHK